MDGLMSICCREHVDVSYQPLDPTRGLLGMYLRDGPRRQGIILDKGLATQPRLERCVMAEEVGHHMTTGAGTVFVVHFSYHVAIEMTRTEERALRWGAEYLMPTIDVAQAIKAGCHSIEDLADHFYVTDWMVRLKLRFIRRDLRKEQGLRVKGLRDLFAPLLVDALWGYNEGRQEWRLEVSKGGST